MYETVLRVSDLEQLLLSSSSWGNFCFKQALVTCKFSFCQALTYHSSSFLLGAVTIGEFAKDVESNELALQNLGVNTKLGSSCCLSDLCPGLGYWQKNGSRKCTVCVCASEDFS